MKRAPTAHRCAVARPHDPGLANLTLPDRRSFRVELHGKWPVDVMVYRKDASKDPNMGWVFKVGSESPDRETGEFESFATTYYMDFHSGVVTRAKVAAAVKEFLLGQFAHEIEELLSIDGMLAFPSPHGAKPKRKKVAKLGKDRARAGGSK